MILVDRREDHVWDDAHSKAEGFSAMQRKTTAEARPRGLTLRGFKCCLFGAVFCGSLGVL